MEKMNIYQRINEVRKAIGYVQKDKDVGFGKSCYKAVTHDAVTGMVRDALIKQGVVIVTSVVSATFHPAELVQQANDAGSVVTVSAKQRLYEATFEVAFVNMDDPQDRITTQQNAHALDNGDKAPGKAQSYATKYAILKLFNIETGEDEESRYQQEEFDTIGAVDYILASTSLAEVKARYEQRYKLAAEVKDKDAMKAIIAAKDKMKAALSTEMAGQA
jgi:hypothetical protein